MSRKFSCDWCDNGTVVFHDYGDHVEKCCMSCGSIEPIEQKKKIEVGKMVKKLVFEKMSDETLERSRKKFYYSYLLCRAEKLRRECKR